MREQQSHQQVSTPTSSVADQEEIEKSKRDVLNVDYRTILSELALLTTVSVLLFGFLLTNARQAGSRLEEWLYSAAMVLVSSATLVFILPALYHHLEYPYEDFHKFQARTHFWIVIGSPLLVAGLYLSLTLSIWRLFAEGAMAIAALPLLALVVVFALRKGKF